MSSQIFSDTTQIAGLRQAIASIEKDQALSPDRRAYWVDVMNCIADRIEDAAARRRQAEKRDRKP